MSKLKTFVLNTLVSFEFGEQTFFGNYRDPFFGYKIKTFMKSKALQTNEL